MRSIDQATPKQDMDSDYGSVEDTMFRANTDAPENEENRISRQRIQVGKRLDVKRGK